MMDEQLISFETAKLAKEKGFDEFCLNIYNNIGELEDSFDLEEELEFMTKATELRNSLLCKNTQYDDNTWISAPTQSLLQKWLREKHNVEFVIKPFRDSSLNKTTYVADPINIITGRTARIKRCDTYEEALEKGLQEALKLI